MRKEKKYNVEKIRRLYPRAYEPWLAEEDETLWLFQDRPINELAQMVKRQPGAIESRLKKLREAKGGTLVALAEPAERDLREPLPALSNSFASGEPAGKSKRPWTLADDDRLRRMASTPVSELAEFFQRPADDVELRLYDLGIYRRGEAPFGPSRPGQLKARRRRWQIWVGCSLVIGLLLGLAAGFVARGSRPSAAELPQRPQPRSDTPAPAVQPDACITVASWNLRGYPERLETDTAWFHAALQKLGAEVLCIQEIANGERLADLLRNQVSFAGAAYSDVGTGQDNAIVAARGVSLEEIDGPDGFQHPVQIAFAAYHGFDAVVITLHLSWEPESRRRDEMRLLEPLVADMLTIDPDVMIVGDFNLRFDEVEALAGRLGMKVLLGSNQAATGTLHSGACYDYFLISPDLEAEEARGAMVAAFDGADLEVARRVSDHLPLLAFFVCDERFRDRALLSASAQPEKPSKSQGGFPMGVSREWTCVPTLQGSL